MFHAPDGNGEAGHFHTRGFGEISRKTSFTQLILHYLGCSAFIGDCQKSNCLPTNDKNINSQECK